MNDIHFEKNLNLFDDVPHMSNLYDGLILPKPTNPLDVILILSTPPLT